MYMVFAIVLWISPTHHTSGGDNMKHIWPENHSLCVMFPLFLWPGVGRLTRTKPNLKIFVVNLVSWRLTWPGQLGGAVTVTRESPPNPAPCPVIASDSREQIFVTPTLSITTFCIRPRRTSAPVTCEDQCSLCDDSLRFPTQMLFIII